VARGHRFLRIPRLSFTDNSAGEPEFSSCYSDWQWAPASPDITDIRSSDPTTCGPLCNLLSERSSIRAAKMSRRSATNLRRSPPFPTTVTSTASIPNGSGLCASLTPFQSGFPAFPGRTPQDEIRPETRETSTLVVHIRIRDAVAVSSSREVRGSAAVVNYAVRATKCRRAASRS
jgi:hypothetical protein